MKNYQNSDYALNKHSGGIVYYGTAYSLSDKSRASYHFSHTRREGAYRFADKIVEITLADYLAANPGKTEGDFLAIKAFSTMGWHIR